MGGNRWRERAAAAAAEEEVEEEEDGSEQFHNDWYEGVGTHCAADAIRHSHVRGICADCYDSSV